jgi:uracil-DNA glycosylase
MAALKLVVSRLSPVSPTTGDHVPGAKGVVLMAWGAHAQKACSFVDKVSNRGIGGGSTQLICSPQSKHLVLSSAHPSPLSASRGFIGNQHFKKANEWLEERYGPGGGIDWDSLNKSA